MPSAREGLLQGHSGLRTCVMLGSRMGLPCVATSSPCHWVLLLQGCGCSEATWRFLSAVLQEGDVVLPPEPRALPVGSHSLGTTF